MGITASWDLLSFLENVGSYMKEAGGLLLIIMGVGALVWAGVRVVQKLWGEGHQAQQISWLKIILLVIVGGALCTGGWTFMYDIGQGGETTIEELGTGS